ncbi:MAG TPA: putative toxin-antitoxin system toxin component, PIN family [Thermomicrobiales bacterium]|nr:putative toxin-antitoxin system toxin component, PIN family [Thermomicrobiales bacterium]
MQRVVIDANVWISAFLLPGSIPGEVVNLARTNQIRSILSAELIDQIYRSLPKLGYSQEDAAVARVEIREISELVVPAIRLVVITAKESDNRVLECAVAGRADVIVTGDRKHLLPLGSHAGIPVMTPAEFLQARTLGSRRGIRQCISALPRTLRPGDWAATAALAS